MPLGNQAVLLYEMLLAQTPLLHLISPMHATRKARAVVVLAEERKRVIYRDLTATHHFVIFVVEISGAFGLEELVLSCFFHEHVEV